MKNERGIPGIAELQLQRKQRMVKRMATKLSSMASCNAGEGGHIALERR
jgi:hypothetical protein